jgi:signal transduction histidine kinase
MDIFANFDLLLIGVVIAGIFVLGFTVLFSNRKSITNQTFLLFCVITGAWGIVNYLFYNTTDTFLILWLLRFVMFFAVLQAFSLFQLFLVFPLEKVYFPKIYKYGLIPLVFLTAIIALSPLTFSKIVQNEIGTVADPDRGPGLIAFGFVAVGLVVFSLISLIKKIVHTEKEDRGPYLVLLYGVLLMFLLIICFNFLIPVITHNRNFIPFGALFTLPFIIFTSYAILKHKLFNIKVAATALLVFILAVISFAEVVLANGESYLILFRSSIFVLVLVFGISLIRGVLREVEQREKIQILAKELDVANKRQAELLYFVTHQIKGFLTNTKGALSMILEGDYGEVPEQLRTVIQQVYKSENNGVEMVQTFLNSSKIEQGTMQYNMQRVDLQKLLEEIVDEQRPSIKSKGLKIDEEYPPHNEYFVSADKVQIREAIFNLIDNSVKYTPKGGILVSLSKNKDGVLVSVKDTGVGITENDMKKMFTKYGHGENSRKVNVNSNGLGLYLVKRIIEDHKGKVWVESLGQDKGSQFYILFPNA